MPETRRASSASLPSPRRRAAPRPRLPHPRYDPPVNLDAAETPRPAAEETLAPATDAIPAISAMPTRAAAPAVIANIAIDTLPPTEPQAFPRPPRRAVPHGDRKVLAVLLAGLALNALALLGSAPLSRADLGLGITVFLAGIALLVAQEVYRRQRR
jgi:hypothetical protein